MQRCRIMEPGSPARDSHLASVRLIPRTQKRQRQSQSLVREISASGLSRQTVHTGGVTVGVQRCPRSSH